MIQVKQTLYIISSDGTYLHCDCDAVEIVTKNEQGCEKKTRIPVLNISQIIIFGPTTISDFFIRFCSENKIFVSYVSQDGRYYGGLRGQYIGNVLLRRRQYQLYDLEAQRIAVVKNIILGKGVNQQALLMYIQEHGASRISSDSIKQISGYLSDIGDARTIDELRGIEGKIATTYFSEFDHMLNVKDQMMLFRERSKRPPKNNCNAALSFFYTMLMTNCVAALETFGLDSYMGYLHELRPGRESLACDLEEEFRAPFVDFFVVNMINSKKITNKDFERLDEGVFLSKNGRKKLLEEWEKYKNEKISFPLYKKMVPRKVIPYLQAQLMAQFVRGDISEYPPFIWEV